MYKRQAVYPNHDSKNVRQGAPVFTTIRALPSFRGLLLAITSQMCIRDRYREPPDPVLEAVAALVTAERPEWSLSLIHI